MLFRKRVDRQIAEYQNELISKHCDEVENIYRQMRSWRHDYHNHIQAMKAYIALDQYTKLDEYCDKLDDDLKTVDSVIKTGNIMVDAILNSKLSLATSKKIIITAKATVPPQLDISDVDLCVLIGNLLDNAMEACAKKDGCNPIDINTPFIRVYIGMKGTQLYICVTNTVFGTPKKVGSRYVSTKDSTTHGFGLIRIDKICDKYLGYCNRNSEPGAFTTEILLPISQKR